MVLFSSVDQLGGGGGGGGGGRRGSCRSGNKVVNLLGLFISKFPGHTMCS